MTILTATPATVKVVLASVKPGDEVRLEGEFGTALKIKLDGTETDLIRFDASGAVFDGKFLYPKPPANAVLMKAPDGTTAHYVPLVQVEGSYLELTGFTIRQSWGRGLGLLNCKHVSVLSSSVDLSRNAGIHTDGCEDILFEKVKNTHAGCYYTDMRDPAKFNWPVSWNTLRSKKVRIQWCESSDNYGESIGLDRDTGQDGDEPDSIIEDCIFRDNMVMGIYLHHCYNCAAVNNMIVVTDGARFIQQGIVVNNEDNFPNSQTAGKLRAVNNLLIGTKNGLNIWGNETSGVVTDGVDFLFNTVVNSKEAGMLYRTRGAKNVRVIGNLFHEAQGTVWNIVGDPQLTEFGPNGYTGIPQSGVAANPGDLNGLEMMDPDAPVGMIVDPNNYALKWQAGIGPIVGMADYDLLSAQREVYTVGALEFIPPPPPPPPVEESITITGTPEAIAALRLLIDGSEGLLRVT